MLRSRLTANNYLAAEFCAPLGQQIAFFSIWQAKLILCEFVIAKKAKAARKKSGSESGAAGVCININLGLPLTSIIINLMFLLLHMQNHIQRNNSAELFYPPSFCYLRTHAPVTSLFTLGV